MTQTARSQMDATLRLVDLPGPEPETPVQALKRRQAEIKAEAAGLVTDIVGEIEAVRKKVVELGDGDGLIAPGVLEYLKNFEQAASTTVTGVTSLQRKA